jgi:hypothetical protein
VHRYQWIYAFFLYMILTLYWGLLKDLVQFFHYKKAGLNKQTKAQNAVWLFKTTLVKTLYFAAARDRNIRGELQFDLYRIGVKEEVGEDGVKDIRTADTGSGERLTTDGSQDMFPAWAEDRGELYFLSNRGAAVWGAEDALAIFRLKP